MASAIDVRRSVPGIAAMLATAVLVWFGTGLNPFWPCMWLAPVPVLLFALGASWWTAALVAGGAMLLGLLNLWGLLHGALRLPLGALLPLYVTEGVMFALATLLFRALARRGWHGSCAAGLPGLLGCLRVVNESDRTARHRREPRLLDSCASCRS